MRGGVPACPGQQWQGLGDRQGERGDGASADSGAVPPYDRQFGPLARREPLAVRIPERDPSLAGKWCGQEDGGEAHGHRRVGPHRFDLGNRRTRRIHAVPHTPGHLPPLSRISCLRLYGRGLTIGLGDPAGPGPGQGIVRETT